VPNTELQLVDLSEINRIEIHVNVVFLNFKLKIRQMEVDCKYHYLNTYGEAYIVL
jgi:hypothetical protein